MNQIMKNLIFLLSAMIASLGSFGQQSINTAGGEATGQGSASFSVGQVSYTAIENGGGENLIQGVQIPFEYFGQTPDNDNCLPLTAESADYFLECGQEIEGTTVSATETVGLSAECATFNSASPNDVWYFFQADGSTDYTVTIDTNAATSASLMDAVLFIYSGTCGNLTEVACADENFGPTFTGESITLDAPAAGFYYVRVISYFAESPFVVSLTCSGGCENPFPAVSEASLSTTQLGNAFATEWAPVSGQIGCQLQVRFAGGAILGAQIVGGAGADGFNIPLNVLQPGTDYEWRVRCGCSQSPLVAGPFSSWQPFSTPSGAALASNPNPTSGQSNVTFTLAEEGYTTLEVFDLSGRLIDGLFNGLATSNNDYRFTFDGSFLPNGVYVYRLTTESEVINEKFMIAR
jgi:hypothetical protein